MPLLVLFLDLPERVATATSLGAIGITALAGVVVFGVRGDIDVGYATLVGIPATAGALDERFEEWVRADPDWEVVAPVLRCLLPPPRVQRGGMSGCWSA